VGWRGLGSRPVGFAGRDKLWWVWPEQRRFAEWAQDSGEAAGGAQTAQSSGQPRRAHSATISRGTQWGQEGGGPRPRPRAGARSTNWVGGVMELGESVTQDHGTRRSGCLAL